jgi:hypothetical protein
MNLAEQVFENLDQFSDATFICSDGKVKFNRLLVSLNSPYLMTVFIKYSNGQNHFPLLEYSVIVVKTYLKYCLTNHLDISGLIENKIEEFFYFASFIQDFAFLYRIRDQVWSELTNEEKHKLNTLVKYLMLQ